MNAGGSGCAEIVPDPKGRVSEVDIRDFTALLADQAEPLSRLTVAGENLRRATDAAAEGFVEGDAAQLPSVRLTLPFQPPFGDPSEILIAPHEMADQGDLAALLGGGGSERSSRQVR